MLFFMTYNLPKVRQKTCANTSIGNMVRTMTLRFRICDKIVSYLLYPCLQLEFSKNHKIYVGIIANVVLQFSSLFVPHSVRKCQ